MLLGGADDDAVARHQEVRGILGELREGDLVMITADHGNDPTYRGTDHTREYVPLLTFLRGGAQGVDLGVRASFADIGATLARATC